MKYLILLISLIVIYLLAFLVSNNKRNIQHKWLISMLLIQIIFAFIFLNTSVGSTLIGGFADTFAQLLNFANIGTTFVFGNLVQKDSFVFFFDVLMPIVFVSAIIGILEYSGILGLVIRGVGWVLSKVSGMGRLESYNGLATLIFGQSEVFISLKKQLGQLTPPRLYTLCASAMSTVSMSIVGSYMHLLQPRYVVTALVLNLFGGFMISSIINPYKVDPENDLLVLENPRRQNFFEMLGEYILDGFKVAIIVGAMLIGYIALIALVNAIFVKITGFAFQGAFTVDFQTLAGYFFAPFAILMGVTPADSIHVGSLMATKLFSNEFVAMTELPHYKGMSERSIGILSVFLVSFANFSSIGIVTGAINALNAEQGREAARMGLRLLYGATLVSLLSGTIAGLFIS